MIDLGVYGASDLLEETFRAQGFNKMTFGDSEELDLDKQTIFPYTHLTLVSTNETGKAATFNFEFASMDLNDINFISPRDTEDVFSRTDNELDILHDLEFRLSKVLQSLKVDDRIFGASETFNLTVFYFLGKNKLVGYQGTIAITIESTGVC